MIAPTPEHALSLDSLALPCRMAAQHICRAESPKYEEWVEFLVRPGPPHDHLNPLEFVESGYRRRGLLFDQDIFTHCLEASKLFPESTWFSINVHPNSLHREQFVDFVRFGLERHGVDPRRVVLELVEFGGPVNLMASRSSIEELRDDGLRFALDDFGPGFSNLDLIGSGLIDFVKLDRSLVRFVDSQPGYAQLVSGLQAFASATDVVLVAEGAESAAQVSMLKDLGIEWIQGFHFSRPRVLAPAAVRSEA